jgi:hypothetical protein
MEQSVAQAPQLHADSQNTNDIVLIYAHICEQIIKVQYQIIGTLALEQANQVAGLHVDSVTFQCTISGNGKMVVEEMIHKYRDFFGNAAVEVCKEAASRFIARLPKDSMPISLAS